MPVISRREPVSRKSVPLTDADLGLVDRIRAPSSAERHALAEILGIELSANPSQAEVLQALVEAGRTAVERRVADRGYAALAKARDDEDEAYEQAMRARKRGTSGE